MSSNNNRPNNNKIDPADPSRSGGDKDCGLLEDSEAAAAAIEAGALPDFKDQTRSHRSQQQESMEAAAAVRSVISVQGVEIPSGGDGISAHTQPAAVLETLGRRHPQQHNSPPGINAKNTVGSHYQQQQQQQQQPNPQLPHAINNGDPLEQYSDDDDEESNVDTTSKDPRKKYCMWSLVAVVVVAAGIIAVVVVLMSSSSNGNNKTNDNGPPPSPTENLPTENSPPVLGPLETKLTATDGAAGDSFGESVAVAGTTLVIGAPRDNNIKGEDAGVVYVYTQQQQSSGGNWTLQTKLMATDGVAGDLFGTSVDIVGDTVVVGAVPQFRHSSVYVYKQSLGGDWREQAKLMASDNTDLDKSYLDQFGNAVALSEDETTLVVGSYLDNDKGTDSGSVYVFAQSTDGRWVEESKLTASDGGVEFHFGVSVDISGSTIVVGSNRDGEANSEVGFQGGSAFVFERTTTTEGNPWTQRAKLTPSDQVFGERFGQSVAISGDGIVVGAPGLTIGSDRIGKAYLFKLSESMTWTEQAILLASDGISLNRFGYSVAISEDGTVVVGAYGDDSDQGADVGSVYLFTEVTRTEQAKLTASDAAAAALFGRSVAISGNTIVVGASGGNGSAYVIDQRQLN